MGRGGGLPVDAADEFEFGGVGAGLHFGEDVGLTGEVVEALLVAEHFILKS